ncbi:MAG: helix-turn-helix domain-containing protein [Eubacterium sp.]|nr:helix-turn-helix domain-containing protein [Eubacterium sp.]
MNTGEKIKYFRLARNMTQEQLAQEAEISFSTLRKYEANERNPKYEQLLKIASALEISVNIFMDFDIQTISDLFSILFKMENQADLKINTMQELDAASSEDALFLHFQNNYINQVLKTYYSSTKSINNIDTQHQNTALAEIQNRLLDNNTSIHSDISTLSDVSVNPVLPLSSADQTWLDLSSDCTEEEKKEMLKAAAFTKNCLHRSSK